MAWSSERNPAAGGSDAGRTGRRRLVARALSLSARERRYLAIAVLELLRARLRFAVLSSADCLAGLRERAARGGAAPPGMETPDGPARDALEGIAWAIPAAARHVPWRADCLIQALAADRWLRRRGLAPEFFLGVTRGGQGEVLAHAWVRCGGVTVTGAGQGEFSVLVGPADGR